MAFSHLVLGFSLLLLGLPGVLRVDAYPTQAGHCLTGASIGEESNGQHGRNGSGTILDGAFQLRVGSSLILEPGNLTTLVSGENYTLTLESGNGLSAFRGFLIRLSGVNGENMQEALVVADADRTQLLKSTGETVGLTATCAQGVAGLTHTSRVDKESIVADLLVSASAQAFLEVTIVTNNQGGGQNDWYYSAFELQFSDGTNETLQPSISPQPSSSQVPSQGPSSSMIPTATLTPTLTLGNSSLVPTASTRPSDSMMPIGSQTPTAAVGNASLIPTVSSRPSSSSVPSHSPSESPAPSESKAPSLLPSESLKPSHSQLPSGSLVPSVTPVPTGSHQPSVLTNGPSLATGPSHTPSGIPSSAPSSIPSLIPSNYPSAQQISNIPGTTATPTAIALDPTTPSLFECRWWCGVIPVPWTSSDPTAYPKCDWTYSCSICPECSNGDGVGRRRHRRLRIR